MNFDQRVLYEDQGGTDWYVTKFDITAQAVLNIDMLNLVAPDLEGDLSPANAAEVMNYIRTRLLRPRRKLSVKFNDVELIPAVQEGCNTNEARGRIDAKNGPMPQACVVNQLNNTTFLITYNITAHYWENVDPADGPISQGRAPNRIGNNVLYNRWSETVDIDNCEMTKQRIREGKFAIRSDNASGAIADQLRAQFAVVGVPPGFLRQSSNYTVTPDGLAIQYRVVDTECYKYPPKPAYEASGEYTESSSHNDALRYGECRVTLRGAKLTSQAKLIETAVAVCHTKIGISGVPGKINTTLRSVGIPQSTYIRVNLWENVVEAYARVMFTVGNSPLRRHHPVHEQAGAEAGAAGGLPARLYDRGHGQHPAPGGSLLRPESGGQLPGQDGELVRGWQLPGQEH